MSMILAIDAGNSRVKWGLYDGTWVAKGIVPNADIVRLGEAWKRYAPPSQIIVSNVAGEKVRSLLSVLFIRWRLNPVWIAAKKNQCGVVNHYHTPAELGSDRWAALIGAWSLYKTGCLVVSVGTAMTVDVLSDQGEFLGGIITPGIFLMQETLARKTANLESLPGEFKACPRNTADALYSGTIHALNGAIERMAQGQAKNLDQIVLTGGAAEVLKPHLLVSAHYQESLVLDGLISIAQEKVVA